MTPLAGDIRNEGQAFITLRLEEDTPSWHLGVPAGPGRWRKHCWPRPAVMVVDYEAHEFGWGIALGYDPDGERDEDGLLPYGIPLVAVLRALELAGRGEQ